MLFDLESTCLIKKIRKVKNKKIKKHVYLKKNHM